MDMPLPRILGRRIRSVALALGFDRSGFLMVSSLVALFATVMVVVLRQTDRLLVPG